VTAAPATAPDTFLDECANLIRQLGKTALANVIEIGRLLTECRRRLPHGAWLPWLEREFGWTDRTALNYMRLYAMASKSEIVSDLDLPLRDLYLLAAPSTPEAARQEIIEHAEAGDRLHHDDIAAIIAEHGEGKVLRAAKQLRAERAEQRRTARLERIAQIAKGNTKLPTGRRFPILLADAAWRFKSFAGDEPSDRAPDYQTNEIDEICALPVADIATDPAILFFWTTSPFLKLAFDVISAWGFEYSTSAVWDKSANGPGLGYIFRIDHEFVLTALRGDFPSPPTMTRRSSVIHAPKREHSRKPDELYEYIEAMYPDLPKIELFARHARPGWANWGNQIGQHPEAAE
jgi:N6-adenosine-specific RNA methylase IME4